MRLVHEALVAALDERKAVPEEVLRSGGLGTARPPTVTVIRAGELAVDMVVVGVLPFALGDGKDLVEITVAVGLASLADETSRRVVGVLGGHAVGGGRDELVRAVEGEGGGFAADRLLEHIARLVVGVALDMHAVLLHREELATKIK